MAWPTHHPLPCQLTRPNMAHQGARPISGGVEVCPLPRFPVPGSPVPISPEARSEPGRHLPTGTEVLPQHRICRALTEPQVICVSKIRPGCKSGGRKLSFPIQPEGDEMYCHRLPSLQNRV